MGQPRTNEEATRTDTCLAVDDALEAALWVRLGTYPQPIYVVPPQGPVGAVSASAEALLASDRAAVERRLAAITRSLELEWYRLPLTDRVLHLTVPRPRQRTVAERVTDAATDWMLTPRQTEVLGALAEGHSTRLIASMLGVATVTVEKHISAIFTAAQVADRVSLMLRVLSPSPEHVAPVLLPGVLVRNLAPPSGQGAHESEAAIKQVLSVLESRGWDPVAPTGRLPRPPQQGVLVVTPAEVTPERLAQRLGTLVGASRPERRVLALLLHGRCNKEMACELGCSEVTVEGHLTRLYRRTRTNSRYQLIVQACTQLLGG